MHPPRHLRLSVDGHLRLQHHLPPGDVGQELHGMVAEHDAVEVGAEGDEAAGLGLLVEGLELGGAEEGAVVEDGDEGGAAADGDDVGVDNVEGEE